MDKSKRQIQKEQTREKIIKTAYEQFGKRGILNTRMSDIAVAAGISHGSVFAHFETQEALVSTVIEVYCGKIAQRTHELTENSSTVRDLLRAHLSGIKEYEPFYTRLAMEARLLPEQSRSVLSSMQSAVSFHLSRAAEREMREGIIREMPVSFLFNTWMGLINYYLVNGDLFTPDGKVIEHCGEELLDNFMRLISTNRNE